MTIPSEDEFGESIGLLETLDAIELVEKYWVLPALDTSSSEQVRKRSRMEELIKNQAPFRKYHWEYSIYGQFNLEIRRADIEQFLRDKEDLLSEKTNKLCETPAFNWLASQPAFRASSKSIFRTPRNGNDDFEQRFERQVSELLSSKSIEALQRKVRDIIERKYGEFHLTLLSELKSYFYSDHEEYFAALKKREVVAKKAKKVIDELVDIETAISELEASSSYISSKQEKIQRLLKRTSLEIEDMTIIPRKKPVIKSDLTAKERLLVFNLWTSLRSNLRGRARSNFVTAISHLMYLEGIENPIGQRAIEKLIQGWKSKHKNFQDNSLDSEQWEERQQLKRKYPVYLR